MNKNAFDILQNAGLKTAAVYSPDDMEKLQDNTEIFLRYIESLKFNNRKVDIKYIRDNISQISKQFELGELIQIAESINSIAGSSVYIKDGYIYGEYVEGNIIMLLRRGICGKRFLITPENNVITIPVFQNWICVEKKCRCFWLPFDGKISSAFDILIESLKNTIDKSNEDLLLEILVENDGIVFCDAKYQKIKMPSDIFFCEDIFIPIKGDCIIDKNVKIDGFDIDYSDFLSKNIMICNGAFLSHYITHNFEKIKNLVYKNHF
jgi:hypothetical protein